MKLTDTQKYQIREAFDKSNAVLQQIKRKTLTKKEIEDMKILESAVSELEVIIMIAK